jgi:hypothetical protein
MEISTENVNTGDGGGGRAETENGIWFEKLI